MMNVIRAGKSSRGLLQTPHTLNSPDDVHHSVNLFNTNFIS